MARRGGLLGRALEEVETRTNLTVQRRDLAEATAARAREYGVVRRELDLIGYSVLDMVSGNPTELTPQARQHWVKQARMVYREDPQAAAAVDLLNDFTLGRGIPKPRAKDPAVQEVIDEFWEDPDNKLVLTSYEAQLAFNTDLTLQCNIFVLLFEGEDGKLKLGLLPHDSVDRAVRDPENRLRVLYYGASRQRTKYNYTTDSQEVDMAAQPVVEYFEHWRNLDVLREEGRDLSDIEAPPERVGEGRVYHIAINRGTEEVFGTPSMRRLIRWFSAYNSFLAARVDLMQAAAALVMRRKVKGTPTQVAKLAAQALSRRSELAGATGTEGSPPQVPPPPGAIVTENENVTHEQLPINTGAGGATMDAQMLRAAISAGTRWPQAYLGDPSNANHATMTSLELPTLKGVENRQEVLESLVRALVDRAIQRAVDANRLTLTVEREGEAGELGGPDDTGPFGPAALQASKLVEYENRAEDEERTQRDLSYEFAMPNPLKRMMGDLVNAVANVAKTFDPNGTNMELNRTLLTIVFAEAFEMEDPADAVERIFPEGYVDPMLAQQQQQPPPPPEPDLVPVDEGPGVGAGGEQPGRAAPGTSAKYVNSQGQMDEARFADLPGPVRRGREEHLDAVDDMLDDELAVLAGRLGHKLAVNGNGSHRG